MDVRLSPEQRALRDSAAQLVERLRPETVRELDDHERAAKLDAAVAASGWRELRTADDDGAPWASAVEACIVAEELARGLADTAFVGPTLAAELRRLAGLAAATSAESTAFTGDLSALATAAAGRLPAGTVAVDAAGATSALALLASQDRWALASVPVTQPAGVPVDLTRPTVALDSGATVTPLGDDAVISPELLDRWTAFGLALTCADLVGTMRGAVRLARDYACTRRQYGAPIGSFQAVQHLLADAHVATEGSRSVTLHAAWAVDALPAREAVTAAAVAKAYCARAARSVCETAIQVHGGIGNTWECLAHVHLRRAVVSTDLLGGVGPSLTRVLGHHGIGG